VDLSRRDFVFTLLAAHSPQEKSRLKTVAFNYAARSSLSNLQFYSKFNLVVIGGLLASDQLRIPRSRGAALVLYQWSSALYSGEGPLAYKRWENEVVQNASAWLLAPGPLEGGAASEGKPALWYDFGDPDLQSALARQIHTLVAEHGYQGVFLDTLGFASLPSVAQRAFKQRHSTLNYNVCQGDFLSKLRGLLGPRAIIFTNQGYRNPDCFLPHADYDLIENSCTYIASDGTTRFRPWAEVGKEWESIQVPLDELIIPASRRFPHTQFVHLNYVVGNNEAQQRAVSYGYACAKLWNHSSFTAPAGVQKAIPDSIYFTDLGEPLTTSYEQDRAAGVAWRRFRNGIVAINSSAKPYRVHPENLYLPDPPRGYLFLNYR
jgi:hypothetical protein